jgi:MFS transporter, ACS family, glucarate transporter
MSPTTTSSAAKSVPLPASRSRYWVVVFAVTLAILSYIDRVSISQAAGRIQKDLHLDDQEIGAIFGAFGLAYALFEIPGGWLGDWLGARKVLIRIVLCWSAFTALTGAAWSKVSLWIIRFAFGAGEAGCFPNITKALSVWLPAEERVRGQAIVWAFARWGGAFTPPLVVLAFQYMSWRIAFVAFGCLGVVWCLIFMWWYKDDPREHPGVNQGERDLLAGVASNSAGHGNVPWGKLVRSRSVWLLWGQYFCMSFPWYFYITFLPKYLSEHRHLTEAQASRYAILPLLFGGFGSLFAGFTANRMTQVLGGLARGRRLLSVAAFLGASFFLVAVTQIGDPLWAMLAMGMASFCNDLNMPGAWGTCMDIGRKYAGTLSGSMNMMGNLAGFVAPVTGGFILKNFNKDYDLFLYLMAAIYLLGACMWPFIDPVTPIDQTPE